MAVASLDRWSDATLAALRVLTGAYLVNATWAAMPGAARVTGIVGGLAELDLPSPAVLPPFLATVQFVAGVLLIAGLLTRWAGLLVAAFVIVLLIRSGLSDPLGGGWPRLLLLVLGLHFATSGPGRFAIDGLFGRRSAGAGGGKRR